jgi:hypothetical protein
VIRDRRVVVSVRPSYGLCSNAQSLRSPADSNANEPGQKSVTPSGLSSRSQSQSEGMYSIQPASQRSNAKRRMSDERMIQSNEERVA